MIEHILMSLTLNLPEDTWQHCSISNDVEEGRHTVFPFQDRTVHPKKGPVIFFPPTWEYPHAGEPPVSNSVHKDTYLHYDNVELRSTKLTLQ